MCFRVDYTDVDLPNDVNPPNDSAIPVNNASGENVSNVVQPSSSVAANNAVVDANAVVDVNAPAPDGAVNDGQNVIDMGFGPENVAQMRQQLHAEFNERRRNVAQNDQNPRPNVQNAPAAAVQLADRVSVFPKNKFNLKLTLNTCLNRNLCIFSVSLAK